MKVLDKQTKFAHLGKPGEIFSNGFQRRLDIITKLVDFKDKKILDLGCGEGVWMNKFVDFTNAKNVYGSDIDPDSKEKFQILNLKFEIEKQIPNANVHICPAEKLTFEDNFFDIVFQNEVLEHVEDDKKTLEECLRILKPGGKLIFFTPNRAWPFEQHGAFFQGKYYWGNIPLLPWLPKFVRQKFAPHVRNYSNVDLKNMIKSVEQKGYKFKTLYHWHVFPGFDGLVRKFGLIGQLVQKFIHFLEKTPLEFFGISHLLIVEKT